MPRGFGPILANRTGMSRTFISLVLNGKRHNQEVLEAAVELLEERRRKQEDFDNRLQQVLEPETAQS